MLDACSYEDAAKILMECGYPDMSGLKAPEVEDKLAQHRSEIFEELFQLAPEKAVINVFRLKYDYHNIKVLVKAEGVNASGEHILSTSGRIKRLPLPKPLIMRTYRFVPMYVGAAMEQAKDILARTGNPQLSDLAVDKIYFEEFMARRRTLATNSLWTTAGSS
jgi:V/A-type H+-transporting ATPase subunit C